MNQFRQDNTEGFTDAQLAAMNDEFYRDFQTKLGNLPASGANGIDADLYWQIKQSTAEAVLRRHGAA